MGVWPQTARKLVFAEDDDRGSLLQTVRCKEGMYISEETPELPEEICPSWDEPSEQVHS